MCMGVTLYLDANRSIWIKWNAFAKNILMTFMQQYHSIFQRNILLSIVIWVVMVMQTKCFSWRLKCIPLLEISFNNAISYQVTSPSDGQSAITVHLTTRRIARTALEPSAIVLVTNVMAPLSTEWAASNSTRSYNTLTTVGFIVMLCTIHKCHLEYRNATLTGILIKRNLHIKEIPARAFIGPRCISLLNQLH